MKFKTTQKAIKANYAHIIYVGYCDLPYLLSTIEPIAYTVRREGWGCDIYELAADVALTTGYAPFGMIRPSYAMCRRYEQQAISIICNPCVTIYGYTTIKQDLEELRKQFVQEVLGND